MIYHFKVHKEDNAFWAECAELPGCITDGRTLEELQENAAEALNVYLSEPEDSNFIFPAPKKIATKKGSVIAVAVDPQVALAMTIRQSRVRKKITQQTAAHLMGYKSVFAYQKLESADTCNPTFTTLYQLRKHLEVEVDEIFAESE